MPTGAAVVGVPSPRAGDISADASADGHHATARSVAAPAALVTLFAVTTVYAGRITPYVAEALLVYVLVRVCRPGTALPRCLPAALTALVMALTAVQLAVDLAGGAVVDGELVRNLAVVYYAGFAFAVYALLRDWERRAGRRHALRTVERALVGIAPYLTVYGALLALGKMVLPSFALSWPVPVRVLGATAGVDASPCLAFLLPLLVAAPADTLAGRRRTLLLCLWTFAVLVFTFEGRAFALGLAAGVVLARPDPRRIARAAYTAAVLLVLLWASGVSVAVAHREVSFDAAMEVAQSLVSSGSETPLADGGLVATIDWRSRWWGEIWHDVTDRWLVVRGLGWDVNLADRYGLELYNPEVGDSPLDYPHNLALSLAGHGGLVLAAAFVLVPVTTLARSYRRDTADSFTVHAARAALITVVVTAMADIVVEKAPGGSIHWILVGFLWWLTARPGPTGSSGLVGRPSGLVTEREVTA